MKRAYDLLMARWMLPVYALIPLVLPLVVQGKYGRDLLVLALMFASLATGLNLTMGYVGYLPFGYLIFFAIGAYAAALLSVNLGVTFWLAILAGGLVAGFFAVLVALPSLRLRGPYFAIMTMAFAEIGVLVLYNWTELTRGPMGIFGIPHPRVPLPGGGEFYFKTELSWYYLMLGMLALFLFLTYRLIHSRVGDAFAAIRENEDLAESVGIPTFHYKLLAFTVSAVIGGIVGGAYAHYYTVITPDLAGFYFLVTTFTMVIIGGEGTLAGPVLGALVFTILPELLRAAQLWRMVIFGAMMLAGIVFMPRGIYGMLTDLLAGARERTARAPELLAQTQESTADEHP